MGDPAIFVAVAELPVQEPLEPEALPVTFPVKAPAKPVAVSIPVDGTKLSLVDEPLSGRFPVIAVAQSGYIVAAVVVSSTIVAALA